MQCIYHVTYLLIHIRLCNLDIVFYSDAPIITKPLIRCTLHVQWYCEIISNIKCWVTHVSYSLVFFVVVIQSETYCSFVCQR